MCGKRAQESSVPPIRGIRLPLVPLPGHLRVTGSPPAQLIRPSRYGRSTRRKKNKRRLVRSTTREGSDRPGSPLTFVRSGFSSLHKSFLESALGNRWKRALPPAAFVEQAAAASV